MKGRHLCINMLCTVGSKALSNHVSQTLDTYASHFEPQVLQSNYMRRWCEKRHPQSPKHFHSVKCFLRLFFEHFGLPGSEFWTSSSPSLSVFFPHNNPIPPAEASIACATFGYIRTLRVGLDMPLLRSIAPSSFLKDPKKNSSNNGK